MAKNYYTYKWKMNWHGNHQGLNKNKDYEAEYANDLITITNNKVIEDENTYYSFNTI